MTLDFQYLPHTLVFPWLIIILPFFMSFQAVLKNGVISGSGFMNSGNVRCGSSVCRPISGVFAKNPLPNGKWYWYVRRNCTQRLFFTAGYIHVTTIPAGASNITITELRNSINFLGKLCICSLLIFRHPFGSLSGIMKSRNKKVYHDKKNRIMGTLAKWGRMRLGWVGFGDWLKKITRNMRWQ